MVKRTINDRGLLYVYSDSPCGVHSIDREEIVSY